MRTEPRILTAVAAAVLCCGLLLLPACSDDDPTEPSDQTPPPQAPFPTSPDSLVSLYGIALAGQDTLVHDALFMPEFRYYFSDVDVQAYGLTTNVMTRSEALRAAHNILLGADMVPGRDGLIPGVVRIIVHEFSRQGQWIITPAGSHFPNTEVCRHTLRIDLERPFGLETMSIFGELDVYVFAAQRTGTDGVTRIGYLLAGLEDPQELSGAESGGIPGEGPGPEPGAPTLAKSGAEPRVPGEKVANYTWGMAHATYLDNIPPVANLSVRFTGSFPLPAFELDAQGSLDLDSGLHSLPYRWRSTPDNVWSPWQSATLMRFTYPEAGWATLALEVRDRWGVATLGEELVEIPAAELPFPADPDLLMANFRTTYDHQVAPLIDDLLAAGHVSYLDATAVAAYPTAGPSFAREAELAGVARLFAGQEVTDPLGNPVPTVGLISFGTLERLTDWTLAGDLDRVPGAMRATYAVSLLLNRWDAEELTVDSVVDFYAVARDSLHEAVLQDYWQLIAQDDLGPALKATAQSPGGKAATALSWSGLKAMFRASDPARSPARP